MAKRQRKLVDFFKVATTGDNVDHGQSGDGDAQENLANDQNLDHASDSDDEPEPLAEPLDDTTCAPPQEKKRKCTHTWQETWKNKHKWLTHNDKGMLCTLCIKHNKTNGMTVPGCTNYRTSTLTRHAKSLDHVHSLQAEAMAEPFQKATTNARQKAANQPGVQAAMRTVFWMTKEDLAMKKYPSMMQFLKLQGCEAVQSVSVAKNATYNSIRAGEDMQECVAEMIHQDIISKIKSAKMYSILTDESTDISISKQMVVYCRIADENFMPQTYFLKDITITDPKSDASVLTQAILNYLEEEGLDINKLRAFGSDGASVMVGRKSGVATRLKDISPHLINIHCMAHRFNLSTSQASKNISYLKEFEKCVSDLYYYFGGSKSGNRKCELVAIQTILDDPIVKIKECHEIRWIAFYEAMNAVYTSWLSLVVYFKDKKDQKSTSLYTALRDYRFVSVMHMFMDILPSVAQMSMVLQKQDLDISAVHPCLDGLHDQIKRAKEKKTHHQKDFVEKLVKKKGKDDNGEEVITKLLFKGQELYIHKGMKKLQSVSEEIVKVREDFCDALSKNISLRFPKESVDVASSMSVLGMRPLSFLSEENREAYGVKEMEILISHYGHTKITEKANSEALIDGPATRQEWSLAKRLVMENAYPRDKMKELWKILFMFHKDVLPNMMVLANLMLIMPYQTADCERGFSCQNNIKNSKRNRLSEKSLNQCMTIKIEGGNLESCDFTRAVSIWKDKKDRKIYKY